MKRLFIALNITLAFSTGAFAQTNQSSVYDFPTAESYKAPLASGASNGPVTYDGTDRAGVPTFKAPMTGPVDPATTSSMDGMSNNRFMYHRNKKDGSPGLR